MNYLIKMSPKELKSKASAKENNKTENSLSPEATESQRFSSTQDRLQKLKELRKRKVRSR